MFVCLFSFIGDLVLLAENLSKLSIKFVTNRIYDCKSLLFFLLACLYFSNKQTSMNTLEMQIYFISREFSFNYI